MTEKHDREPTEHTPKGYEVPVPERRAFFGNLRKVAQPDKPVPVEDDPASAQGDPLADDG
jgi:hypothetical protein